MVTKVKEVRPSPIELADIASEKSWDLKKKRISYGGIQRKQH